MAGISYTSTSESQMSPDIGELVDVAYSSADPQIAELREGISWMPFNAVLLFGFAAVGYVIAILYFKLYLDIWLRYRRYLKEKRKYSHQQKCAA
nr:hypothetical protein [Turneriella parva]